MKTHPRTPTFLAAMILPLVLGTGARAQDDTPTATSKPATDDDLATVCKKLREAHGPSREHRAFSTSFQLRSIEQDGPAVSVVAQTEFLLVTFRGREIPLIRTRLKEADANVERGSDEFSMWKRDDGETINVTGNEDLKADAEAIEQDIRFARQFLRFFDPATIVESLEDRAPVREITERVRVPGSRRQEERPRWIVEGELADFPFYYGGEIAPARLRITVDRETGALAKVVATPILDGKPAPRLAEAVIVKELAEEEGLHVPRKMVLQRAQEDGTLKTTLSVECSSLKIDPPLTPKDLRR